jgi:hypothetical protein
MRPNLTTSYPVHIPGIRPVVPLEVKVALPAPVPAVASAPVAATAPVVEVEAEAAPVVEVESEPVAEVVVDTAPVAAPAWSANMTKTELLALAKDKALDVTSSMTKAEILSALDATL